ncbi:MAG: 4-(cytidine 5'-diphospho)-2-C-methyl-D-erythritol kinase [Clostridia bacterium]|nr:4-(cytidine 5'-diphospho)-2-C-methyl-D-erythritol kinase [Clostridia bacterium]
MSLKAPAKINLSLDVISRMENGYHNLSMIMQSISLYDIITIKKIAPDNAKRRFVIDEQGNKVIITCNDKSVPTDEKNIVFKCAKAFFELNNISDSFISIDISKKIPSAAGMAGGSSDGAAVLIGLNILFDKKMTYESLCEIGAKIGADIPFCITGGTALCEGIGEIITPLMPLSSGYILICKPDIDVSTKEIFSKVDIKNIKNHPDTEKLTNAVNSNDLPLLCKNMYNCLEEITSQMHEEISVIEEKIRFFSPLGVMMSGSGPTVFGIFDSDEKCKKAFASLKKEYKECYTAFFCDGIEIINK